MRNEDEDNLILPAVDVLVSEDILQNRDLSQTRNARKAPIILIFKDTADHIHFAFAEADLMVDLALAENWLLNATDICGASLRFDVHGDL